MLNIYNSSFLSSSQIIINKIILENKHYPGFTELYLGSILGREGLLSWTLVLAKASLLSFSIIFNILVHHYLKSQFYNSHYLILRVVAFSHCLFPGIGTLPDCGGVGESKLRQAYLRYRVSYVLWKNQISPIAAVWGLPLFFIWTCKSSAFLSENCQQRLDNTTKPCCFIVC